MEIQELYDLVIRYISGERTKRLVKDISNIHRIQGSSTFLHALQIIKNEIESLGGSPEIRTYHANGKKNYYDWISPIPWNIEEGILELVEPRKELLCDFSSIPECVITHSKACDITAEVLHVEKLSDISSPNDFKDKFILTTENPREIIEKLSELGALGILAYPEESVIKGHNDLIRYLAFWPNADNILKTKSGFSLSRNQAMKLIQFIKSNKKVVVHAKIKSKLEEGNVHVLTTTIDGKRHPNEEIILIAHICHPSPSANDNASGSALLLEIYRALITLIDEKVLPYPDRTIRFLWVPEFSGTIGFIKEQENITDYKPVVCINLDMVGEDPCKVGYPTTLWGESISTPSILSELLDSLFRFVIDDKLTTEMSGWKYPHNYRLSSFAGGSDHILFSDEPFRIPSVMIGHRDDYHHTNLDDIDKVDSTTLKRVGIVSTIATIVYAYRSLFSHYSSLMLLRHYEKKKQIFANILFSEKLRLSKLDKSDRIVITLILNNLFEIFQQHIRKLITNYNEIFNVDQETAIVAFIRKDLKQFLKTLQDSINLKVEELEEDSDSLLLFKKPLRLWKGPIYYRRLMDSVFTFKKSVSEGLSNFQRNQPIKDLEFKLGDYDGAAFELINFIDGKNRIIDIICYLALYFERIPPYQVIEKFMQILNEDKLIKLA